MIWRFDDLCYSHMVLFDISYIRTSWEGYVVSMREKRMHTEFGG
jgi:hypothetical protein